VNFRLRSPNRSPYEAGKDFSVVISCEDFAIAPAACEVLELVEQNVKTTGRLFFKWWNFEVLGMKSLRAMAELEAAEADMIIIGTHKGLALPPEVTDWMSRWLALRNDRPGALLAVLDSDVNGPDDSRGILWHLKQLAAFSHMDFLTFQAMTVGRDAEVTCRIWEAVRQIRQIAAKRYASPVTGLTADVVKIRDSERMARPGN